LWGRRGVGAEAAIDAVMRVVNADSRAGPTTPTRWFCGDWILEGLAQHLQGMAAELRQFIQKETPVVRPRRLARQRHLGAPDQRHIRDGMLGGAARAGGDDSGAPTGEAGDAMGAGASKLPQSTGPCRRIPERLFNTALPGLTEEYLATAEEVPRRTPADPFSIMETSP
jgi:hypothetical protein